MDNLRPRGELPLKTVHTWSDTVKRDGLSTWRLPADARSGEGRAKKQRRHCGRRCLPPGGVARRLH